MAQQHYRLTIEDAIAEHAGLVGVIYRIYCKSTGVSYVEETRQISKGKKLSRISSHYAALKRGCHPARKLQAAWDATNGASIADEILEVVAPVNKVGCDSNNKIWAREKYWQEQYNVSQKEIKSDRHYQLKALELKTLKGAGIINNAALVYFILKLKNPWCDRPVKINPLELAIEWEIPESSVYEAIAKLKAAEVIHINTAEIIISFPNQISDLPEPFQDSRVDSDIPESILISQNGFQDSRMDSDIPENSKPEPSNSKDSSAPHTIQTYSDFIQTLSEGERENFETFIREEWRRLKGDEIVSLDRFLAKPEDQQSWHERFLKSPAGKEAKKRAIASSHDWRNDPCFMEWIYEAFNRGYEWVHEDEAEREQRKTFYDWAFAVNAFEGVCL